MPSQKQFPSRLPGPLLQEAIALILAVFAVFLSTYTGRCAEIPTGGGVPNIVIILADDK